MKRSRAYWKPVPISSSAFSKRASPGSPIPPRHSAGLLVGFTLAHEPLLLDTALRVLEEETHISTRRFLVNLLASFSPAATSVFISRARSGPWYLARNLVIILAQQGHPQIVSILNSFTKHPHPKVRREALKALTCALKRRKPASLSESPMPDTWVRGTRMRLSMTCLSPRGRLKRRHETGHP